MSKFPDVNVGDWVLVNSSIADSSNASWRPALVTASNYDSIECSVFVQDMNMLRIEPRSNVRWKQDPKFNDPQWLANFANDDDAGIFKLTDSHESLTQKYDALLALVEMLATDPKGSKTTVEAALNQLRAEPEKEKPDQSALADNSWRLSALPLKDKKQAKEVEEKMTQAAL